MGFFDSKSKSLTDSKNAGISDVSGVATANNISLTTGKNSTANVVTTDFGAVVKSLDFAGESLKFAQSTQAGIAELARASNSSANSFANSAYALANKARQSAGQEAGGDILKYAAWLAVAGIIAYAYIKR